MAYCNLLFHEYTPVLSIRVLLLRRKMGGWVGWLVGWLVAFWFQ